MMMTPRQLELLPTYVAHLDSKMLPNAVAVADIDGDDVNDFIFGTMDGMIIILKITASDRLVKWMERRVRGCVTSIYVDNKYGSEPRIFVATAAGCCYVFQGAEMSDEFRPSSEIRVPLSVCDVVVHRGRLLVGAREGAIIMFSPQTTEITGFRLESTFEVGEEIESFVTLEDSTAPLHGRLIVRCASGRLLELDIGPDDELAARATAGAVASRGAVTDGAAPFLVSSLHSKGKTDLVACGSIKGRIDVLSPMTDVVWSYEITEGVVGIDKLPITEHDDAVVVGTWGGEVHVVQDPEHVVTFRMLLPMASMHCVSMSSTSTERALIAISTSGTVAIYRNLTCVLNSALNDQPLSELLASIERIQTKINTEKKRKAVVEKLRARGDLAANPKLAALLDKKKTTVEDLVRIATAAEWSV
ncbi:hypothetical protein PINS_up000637 [Pythium insidiosum]|nr:hypothetical protein PINS_up000637 [Pythium insidiosum]